MGTINLPPVWGWGSRIGAAPVQQRYPGWLNINRTNDVAISLTVGSTTTPATIAPADIEAVMRDHPAVADVAVVGVPIAFVGSGERLEDIEPFHADQLNHTCFSPGEPDDSYQTRWYAHACNFVVVACAFGLGRP